MKQTKRNSHRHGYYICNPLNPDDDLQSGIEKKVVSQIRCFNEAGLDCTPIQAPYSGGRLRKGIGSLPGFSDGVDWPKEGVLDGAGYLYIRRPFYSSKQFIEMLASFRRRNPDSIVVIEVPTYPYDSELKSPELFFAVKKDKKYRNQWKKYVDYVADLTGEPSIFGIPTLHIKNGIDSISPRKPRISYQESIDIVCVASFAPWHGYDLLLKGLELYYANGGARQITVHFAGEGPSLPGLKRVAHEARHLDNRVFFHGMLGKSELDDLYNRCNCAAGCLGLHRRSSMVVDSALKTREYLAKGIPFFSKGYVDVFLDHPADFYLSFESNESPVDIEEVISFLDGIARKYTDNRLIERMREYASKTVSMDIAMREVIDVFSGR